MKSATSITIRVFVYEHDCEADILNALHLLIFNDVVKEKINVERTIASGFEEQKIIIYTVKLTKLRHIRAFIKHLMLELTADDKLMLLNQAESRLDSKLNFFIRLDKKKAVDGIYRITDSGDCFHLRIAVAAFPHKRSVALANIKNLIV